jgi:DNA-binding transcriptional ArsR family regulator
MSRHQQLDLIFQALASQPRRLIIDVVKKMPGCCVNDVCEHFQMSRIGVMKHLQILTDAKLVISRKQGRTRALYFNAVPIQMIYDRWTDEYSAFWATQAVDLKYKVESKNKKRTRRSPEKHSSKKRKRKVA